MWKVLNRSFNYSKALICRAFQMQVFEYTPEDMNTFSHVPPGFRFHPTDEELVDYYLRKKVASKRIDLDVIKDVDLYKIEPWDLQELCKIGTDEQNDWYFFSHKDKKYPTGTRTNRATKAGFWKATGRDKAIYRKHSLVGMRKTLVFYKGRAPNGQKSDWIMHEYRLETNENGAPQASNRYVTCFTLCSAFWNPMNQLLIFQQHTVFLSFNFQIYQEEGWVVCRVFKKRMTTVRKMDEHDSLCWYDDQVSFMPDFDSPRRASNPFTSYHNHYSCKQELDQLQYNIPHDHFLQLPHLESPKVPQSAASASCSSVAPYNFERNNAYCNNIEQGVDQVTDWRVLDKFVASQLSQEDATTKEITYTNASMPAEHINMLINDSKRQEMASECTSISTSSCQIDLWK
ncbi:hypothetical protein RJ639_029769 [Escallonia herrerae]|uniref:NAC domain-containing protein n=1 Tax=Escallonia herrerae TaxID=1293975 RepID=A0AA88X2N5_9ASTE|nr:hypothetical protein RJ639_029769 [Escallonia herrerae]